MLTTDLLAKIDNIATRIIEGSGNVFVDLGFDPAEAEVMKLRAEVMIRTAQQLKAQGWTQAEALVAAKKDYDATIRAANDKLGVEVDV